MPQNLGAYVDATTLEGGKQTIAQGPVASQEVIKMMGTNGGGFFNANSAHPYENPNALTNFVQIVHVGLLIGVILIIGGLTFFPALALGPIAEHLAMHAGSLF
jgi:K+-transporting ATPase A subunit